MLRRLTQVFSITAVWAAFAFVPGTMPEHDTGGSMQAAANFEAVADTSGAA